MFGGVQVQAKVQVQRHCYGRLDVFEQASGNSKHLLDLLVLDEEQ